jgi:predicted DNA-binding protein with PD1-like motif
MPFPHRAGGNTVSPSRERVGGALGGARIPGPMQELRDGSRWMLRLDAGEDLFDQLSAFARGAGIRAGVIVSGIGMTSHATVGYWNGREYVNEELAQPHELIALHGSIAEVDGGPSLHLHGAFGGPDHRVVGGHVLRARIGILAEIYVDTFPGAVFGRPMDEAVGLRKLDLHPGATPPV